MSLPEFLEDEPLDLSSPTPPEEGDSITEEETALAPVGLVRETAEESTAESLGSTMLLGSDVSPPPEEAHEPGEQPGDDERDNDASDEEPLPILPVRRFLEKIYFHPRINELTDEQALAAINKLLEVAAKHPEHFQTSHQPRDTAAFARRVKITLKGKTHQQAAEEEGVSYAVISNSHRKLAEISRKLLPLRALTGEEELKLRTPDYPATGSAGSKTSSSTAMQGLSSTPNTRKALARRESLRELASKGEVSPAMYEGLFGKEEMTTLMLLAYGVKTINLPTVMGIDPASSRGYRNMLVRKFGLPVHTPNLAELAYLAAAYQIIPLVRDVKKPDLSLTPEEELAFKLAAQGSTNFESAKHMTIDLETNIGVGRIAALKISARSKLSPGDDMPIGDAFLALANGLLPYKTIKQKQAFADEIRQRTEDAQEELEAIRPATLEELTEKTVYIKRGGRVYRVRRMLTTGQYRATRQKKIDATEEERRLAALFEDENPGIAEESIAGDY